MARKRRHCYRASSRPPGPMRSIRDTIFSLSFGTWSALSRSGNGVGQPVVALPGNPRLRRNDPYRLGPRIAIIFTAYHVYVRWVCGAVTFHDSAMPPATEDKDCTGEWVLLHLFAEDDREAIGSFLHVGHARPDKHLEPTEIRANHNVVIAWRITASSDSLTGRVTSILRPADVTTRSILLPVTVCRVPIGTTPVADCAHDFFFSQPSQCFRVLYAMPRVSQNPFCVSPFPWKSCKFAARYWGRSDSWTSEQ